VARPRLLARLERRWDRRLLTVVAGAGFGKTVLLAAAMAAETTPAGGRDVWLSCEPADKDDAHLIAGLVDALGIPPGSGIEAVLDWVWAQAPTPICLVFDDVHEVAPSSAGAAVLARLVADLPGNGHVLLSSRDNVPLATARLAAGGQLERVIEDDLVLAQPELEAFATSHGVESTLLKSTGGWPALAELTASAGADLVFDYLWEEILARIGLERSQILARFAIVGGGDDEVATALAKRALRVDDLLAGVPLVERSTTGWAALHPLWGPHLRRLLADTEPANALREAAAIHRSRSRYSVAVDLLLEAEDWDGVISILREVEIASVRPRVAARELGRWCSALPQRWREEPEVLLAIGHERKAYSPPEAVAIFEAAACSFRVNEDIDGELAAIAQDGLIRWWIRDFAGLFGLLQRAETLAARGSVSAQGLTAVGKASIAHLRGDSATTLAVLAGADDHLAAGWIPYAHWHRSVAHRRVGELRNARAALDGPGADPLGQFASDLKSAGLHIDWLEGRVEKVCTELAELGRHHGRTGDDFLVRETMLELACKSAWLGRLDTAVRCLASAADLVVNMSGPLAPILGAIAAAAIAVGEGDEHRAVVELEDAVSSALAGSDRWYWRDRAAVALPYVLLPATRASWAEEPLAPTHRTGIRLAEALVAARAGDSSIVQALEWPDPGVIRAHLPLCWIAELAAAGAARGNPAPDDLIEVVGTSLRPALNRLIITSPTPKVAAAARRFLSTLPGEPRAQLHIGVVGPLELHRDDDLIEHRDLRRQRVRQLLCYLIVKGRVRREEAADELWPELDDGGRNLRVTLNYLHGVLEPDRAGRQPPFFVRVEGPWLVLCRDDHLAVDAWDMHARLDEAEVAEKDGSPTLALAAYRAARLLWRGEPFADAPYALWAETARTRLRSRFAAAAVRAGELELAAGDPHEARAFAEAAVAAEQYSEVAYRLLARSHLDEGDRAGAHRALDDCRVALAELSLDVEPTTSELLRTLSD
jgi:LuxR family transcriptional regulator, maltose regulon positive regulatory protein